MNIPDEAVQAAAQACWGYDRQRFIRNGIAVESLAETFADLPKEEQAEYLDSVRPMVEAAAPFIAAHAWREGVEATLDAFDSDGYYEGVSNPYWRATSDTPTNS